MLRGVGGATLADSANPQLPQKLYDASISLPQFGQFVGSVKNMPHAWQYLCEGRFSAAQDGQGMGWSVGIGRFDFQSSVVGCQYIRQERELT